MKKRRILYLTNSFIIGGAERITVDLAKHVDQSRYDLCLGVVTDTAGSESVRAAMVAELEGQGIQHFSLQRRPHQRSLQPLWKLWRMLNEQPVDIIHTGCLHPDFYGQLAGFLAHVPVRLRTLHAEAVWREQSRRLAPLVDPVLNRFTTHVTAVSENVRQQASRAIGLDPEQVRVIPNGVDLERFTVSLDRTAARKALGIGPGPTIGLIGRHYRCKDIPTFLKAAQQIAGHSSHPTFVLVGDGDQRAELEALAETLGIRHQVVFLGQRMDVPDIYPALDVVVNSSLQEGFPVAVLEAFAAGRPVVATAIPGNERVVKHEGTGLLVPVGQPAAMAAALLRLLEDPDLGHRLADQGRQLIRSSYSLAQMARHYEAFYEEALGQTGACLPYAQLTNA